MLDAATLVIRIRDLTEQAEQGLVDAQYNLGYLFCFGEGVPLDKKQAVFWIRKAYENGVDKAIGFWEKNELWKYE